MLPWLHPTIVHFAVALVFVGMVFDFAALWRANEKLFFAGFWTTIAGALGLVVATLTGILAEQNLGPHDRLGDALLGLHRTFAWAATIVGVGLAIVRVAMRGRIKPKTRTLYLSGALVAAVFVLACGGVGGALVYRYGLGISPEAARAVLDAQPKSAAMTLDKPIH